MRVLWFCNLMPSVVAERLKMEVSNKEGWVSGLLTLFLQRQQDDQIELHVAFPAPGELNGRVESGTEQKHMLFYYGFYEDVDHAEKYDVETEVQIRRIIEEVKPDVVHCFGTEYAHTLAAVRCMEDPRRILVGIQGICTAIAQAYMADLPNEIQNKVTFRDWLKKDSLQEQRQKYELRGKREQEIIRLTGNIAGRTDFDRYYTKLWNDKAEYFKMNENLRPCFYEGSWRRANCVQHRIFVSQADYPLKGLHYLLWAAPELVKRYPDLEICVAGNSLVSYETWKDRIKISAYGSYLRHLIEEFRLQGRIRFLGKLTAEEMKRAYLDCGLYLCCSANENSPNSLGEAMILGVPCVAADVGGIPSMLTDGEDGILYKGFRPDSEEASSGKEQADRLTEAISSMWDNEERTDALCMQARRHAARTHNREANYRRILEIYRQIAGRNQEGSL